MKRILALLLCLALCFSLLPAALAEDIEIIDEAEEAIAIVEPEEDIVVEPEEAPFAETVPNADSSVKYRALLVGEVNFPGDTCNRNWGDVQKISGMLKKVVGPQGNAYQVTSKKNLSASGILSAINSTFKDADSNDVSLFFLATHGDVSWGLGSEYAGALLTVEQADEESGWLLLNELADCLKAIPGKIIVVLGSCGSGAAIANGSGNILPADDFDADAAFVDSVIHTFEEADKDMRAADGDEPNTGEFRNSKFYVLTAAALQESSWGQESSDPWNYFPYYFALGANDNMPADSDGNLDITLTEMYNYCYDNSYGPYYYYEDGDGDYETFYQNVQVYPTNSTYSLFRAKLTLNKTSLTLAAKKTATLSTTLSPSFSSKTITWSSSNTSVATVSSKGVVTAKKYGTANITAKISGTNITATCKVNVLFSDVTNSSDYYYKPVYWAAQRGITQGYSDGSFGVGLNCERRELMIFLWRYAGSPTADKNGNPYGNAQQMFSDLQSYDSTTATNKAIAWAYKEGITKGYTDGTFRPTKSIQRKDVLIMLYRLAGKPAVSGTLSFPDCQGSSFVPGTDTYKAILWGSQKGITKGYEDGTFRPTDNCLREQIVTFLYRYYNL